MTRMTPDERKDHLRRCARGLFAQAGYHATGVADIVKAAGVAQGTFYRYFPSKRAIFDDLLDTLLVEIRGAARPVRLDAPSEPPLEQLRANVERVLAVLLANADVAKVLLREAVALDAEAAGKLDRFYEGLLGLIELALDWGRRLGLARAGDPRLQARMVLGTFKEIVDRQVAGGVPIPVPALVDALLAFNTRGLLA